MKKLLFLASMMALLTVFNGCQKEEPVSHPDYRSYISEKKIEIPELKKLISEDKIYRSVKLETSTLLDTITQILLKENAHKIKGIKSAKSLEEMESILNLPLGFFNERINSINHKMKILSIKYNLTLRNENELKIILYNNEAKESYINNIFSLKSADICDEIFERRISQIHESFDNGLAMCATAALVTGNFPGGVICVSFTMYKAINDVAVAIDDYYDCILN